MERVIITKDPSICSVKFAKGERRVTVIANAVERNARHGSGGDLVNLGNQK